METISGAKYMAVPRTVRQAFGCRVVFAKPKVAKLWNCYATVSCAEQYILWLDIAMRYLHIVDVTHSG